MGVGGKGPGWRGCWPAGPSYPGAGAVGPVRGRANLDLRPGCLRWAPCAAAARAEVDLPLGRRWDMGCLPGFVLSCLQLANRLIEDEEIFRTLILYVEMIILFFKF